MSELTLEDFFAESEYGDDKYSQIPEKDRQRINEILSGLSGISEEPDEPVEEPEPT